MQVLKKPLVTTIPGYIESVTVISDDDPEIEMMTMDSVVPSIMDVTLPEEYYECHSMDAIGGEDPDDSGDDEDSANDDEDSANNGNENSADDGNETSANSGNQNEANGGDEEQVDNNNNNKE
jgi:hypothetical protein